MLNTTRGLRPVAVFEEMLRRHPDLSQNIRRTLERRVRHGRLCMAPKEPVSRSATAAVPANSQ